MTIACVIVPSPVWRHTAFVEINLTPQRALVAEQVTIHNPRGCTGELSDVTPEEERLAGFESLRWREARGLVS